MIHLNGNLSLQETLFGIRVENLVLKICMQANQCKPRTEISQIEIEEFYEDLVRNYNPKNRDYFTKPKVDDGVLYEIPIMDLHYGKFASGSLTNGAYDYIIAEKCFNTIITEAIEDIKSRKVAKNSYANRQRPSPF